MIRVAPACGRDDANSLRSIVIQDFGEYRELYQSLLNRRTRPNDIPEFLEAQDISTILAQIEREEAAR